MITRENVVDKIRAYLHHEISLEVLVDWAETAMMEGEFDDRDHDIIREVVAGIGLADVRAFGLTWDECEKLLRALGCSTRVEIVMA